MKKMKLKFLYNLLSLTLFEDFNSRSGKALPSAVNAVPLGPLYTVSTRSVTLEIVVFLLWLGCMCLERGINLRIGTSKLAYTVK